MECPMCPGESGAMAEWANEHVGRAHSGWLPFLCRRCPLTHSSLARATEHAALHHPGLPPLVILKRDALKEGLHQVLTAILLQHNLEYIQGRSKLEDTGEYFRCDNCESSFANRSNLISHLRIHTGEKPHGCGDCGKSFAHSTALFRHQRIHTGEKPLGCDDCGKTFARRTTLVHHIMIHIGLKLFKCQYCGQAFRQRGNQLCHERNKHK